MRWFRLTRRSATAQAHAVDYYADFLRAGGVLTLREWAAQDDETRKAMTAAGTTVWLERAVPGLAMPKRVSDEIRDDVLVFDALKRRDGIGGGLPSP